MLLETVLKHTPPDHDDYEDVSKGLNAIMEVANKVNDSMKLAENSQRVLEIQGIFGGVEVTVRLLKLHSLRSSFTLGCF